MQTIRFIFSDLDGTLLNNKKEVSDETIATIHELKKHGFMFGVATGRPKVGIENNWKQWRIDEYADFVVGSNGGVVWDLKKGTFQDTHLIQPETMHKIYTLMKQFHPNFYQYGLTKVYAHHIDERAKRNGMMNKVEVEQMDVLDMMQQPCHKFSMLFTANQMQDVLAILDKEQGKDFHYVQPIENYIEFSDSRVMKSYGIQTAIAPYQADLSNVIVFGDEGNDLEMLTKAGIGVCMKNGTELAKSHADEITDYTNEEDGVVRHLKKKFL